MSLGDVHCREIKTNDLWYTIYSHGSVEISDVNQQNKVKVLRNNDKITYLTKGQSKNTVTLEEWDKRCMKYFDKYYSQYKKLIFPPSKYQESTLDLLAKKLIKSLDNEDGHLYLFMRYDLINNIRMHLGNTELYDQILQNLLITSDEELKCCNNRMLLINPEYNLIANIRLTEDDDINAINKEEEIGKCDLKLILFLFQRLIKCSGITLMNIIAAPNLSTENNCKRCNKCHVIDGEVFSTIDELRTWLKDKIYQTDTKGTSRWINSNYFCNIWLCWNPSNKPK